MCAQRGRSRAVGAPWAPLFSQGAGHCPEGNHQGRAQGQTDRKEGSCRFQATHSRSCSPTPPPSARLFHLQVPASSAGTGAWEQIPGCSWAWPPLPLSLPPFPSPLPLLPRKCHRTESSTFTAPAVFKRFPGSDTAQECLTSPPPAQHPVRTPPAPPPAPALRTQTQLSCPQIPLCPHLRRRWDMSWVWG